MCDSWTITSRPFLKTITQNDDKLLKGLRRGRSSAILSRQEIDDDFHANEDEDHEDEDEEEQEDFNFNS